MSIEKQKILIKGAHILSMDSKIGNLPVGDVLIEGTKITRVASGITTNDAEIIDATGMILMPGFTDAHRHCWQGTLRRLMPDVSDLMAYVNDVHFGLACHYRPEDVYLANLITALSAIDNGITTLVDASHNTRSYQHALAAVDALQESGIRALYAPGYPLGGDWEESFWPKGLEQLQKERFSDDGLLRMGIFTHMSTEHWNIARHLGVPIVTEFLGSQLSDVLKGLQQKGELGPDNIFNHCTGLSKEAWQIMSDSGVKVTVDPRSDAQYGLEEGVFAYQHAVDHGMKPGIGTDLETAYGGDMFTEMRVAFSLQRAFAQHKKFNGETKIIKPVTAMEILEAATINGTEIAGFGKVSGSITPGKSADLILIDTSAINLFPSNDAVGTVVHAADRSNVDTVMIAGKILKSGGRLVNANLVNLQNRAGESVRYLLEKSGYGKL
ncbi:amidohydrolase family protein [Flavobacterium rakeshii]|uniref:amidohydrolase family protein n=1 Tax=Flavobacterium rakeshii TaxID=1038845 RepID=UPI002E7BAFC8|nr:amidohydrolase family protein [Flavobacterium rakeshii]MEE1900070.1 amidohydrolase family protein [Flavobacterium rakeshii]